MSMVMENAHYLRRIHVTGMVFQSKGKLLWILSMNHVRFCCQIASVENALTIRKTKHEYVSLPHTHGKRLLIWAWFAHLDNEESLHLRASLLLQIICNVNFASHSGHCFLYFLTIQVPSKLWLWPSWQTDISWRKLESQILKTWSMSSSEMFLNFLL